jgi:3-phenylpropionate/cinnamic acid dioxygenase small subunit
MSDRDQITDLISRLGLWIDDKRFDETAALFVDDVTVATPGGQAQGVERVAAQARRNHQSDLTQHVITNVLVDVDGDRATARANLVVTFVPDAAEPSVHRTHGERYRFEATRTTAGWRLSRVEVTPVWVSAQAAAGV